MSKHINKLILVRGLPGSGKSTFSCFSRDIISLGDYFHLEADMFFFNKGEYNFIPSLIKEAHEWCQKTTKVFLNNKENVVVSNTFTRLWEMESYIKMAADLNIPCHVYRMMTQYDNIHDVPLEVIENMRARFEDYPGETLVR